MKELHNQGFSLLELLLVLIVLGIVAVAAIPDLSSSNAHRLELAAGEFAMAMRFARSEAIRSGKPHGFQLQTSEARIRVISADTSSMPWSPNYDVEHPGVHNFYDINLAHRSYAGIDGMTRNATFHGNCNNPDLVYFDASGMSWCGDGSGPLIQRYDVTLSFGSQSRVVSLHGITGRVTVQ